MKKPKYMIVSRAGKKTYTRDIWDESLARGVWEHLSNTEGIEEVTLYERRGVRWVKIARYKQRGK